ncbi:autoinducer 2 import system permease LsrD [Cetobacterium sp. 2A]|uniref:ABC transporter permease subunit n=1 Tax=Cetobacterium sp. 2A TaxID=2754723 RepID=UPI00163CC2B0|nr:autoinducer 2 import system permease LsrD [Cetobacterium sp. 2A]MBC2857319.1 autoinducer 2 import system permease LsrD [Cetobacterium sp. 2A]
MDKVKKIFSNWEVFLTFLLISEILIFGSLNSRILRPNIFLGSINDYSFIIIVALFLTFVFLTGGIDIQSGAIMGLSSITLGILWKNFNINIVVAILLVLLLGALCGLFSRIIIAYIGVQPMIVTLGGSFLFSGLAINVSKIGVSSAFEGISGFPEIFVEFTHTKIFGLPILFILILLIISILYIVLSKTSYGRQVYLSGVSPNAMSYSGLNPKFIVASTYVISGFGAALAGILLTSYLGSARSDAGNELTLPIITTVVLGGTLTTGGKGGVIGTILAGFIIGFLKFGLSMIDVSTQYLNIPVGILLVGVVALRNFKKIKKV